MESDEQIDSEERDENCSTAAKERLEVEEVPVSVEVKKVVGERRMLSSTTKLLAWPREPS